MKTTVKFLSTFSFLLGPVMAMAHPGHGSENPLSPVHYLANPEHAVPIAVTLTAVVVLGWMWKVKTDKVSNKK